MDRNISSKNYWLTILTAIFTVINAGAQDKTDFDSFRESLLQDYNAFKSGVKSDYENYRRSVNENYVNFLRESWENLHRFDPEISPTENVPVVTPVVRPDDEPIIVRPTVDVVPLPQSEPRPQPQPEPKVPVKPDRSPSQKKIDVELYGTLFQLPEPTARILSMGSNGNAEIADVWSRLSDGRMDNTLKECLALRKEYRLNDWAYLNLLRAVGKTLYPGNPNLQTMVTAYLFANSGYKMRLGRKGRNLTMLFASDHLIYQIPYYRLKNEKFYPLDDIGSNIEICTGEFSGERPLSLLMVEEPKLKVKESTPRELRSKKGVVLTSVVNENLMPFYAGYPPSSLRNDPVTRWSFTCNMALCETARNAIYPALQEQLEGLNTYQKVNSLLNLVQTAFTYEYDDKIWGYDRAFFPDEVLYYPYSDCEDRVALFTRLVRDLTGLKCAILYYPGHLAAGVRFPDGESIAGDKIRINGETFLVCDPTYINASAGMSMPGLDNSSISAMVLE